MHLYLLLAILTYLLASIPNALLIGKTFRNIDLRTKGSGNLGATNASRFLGKKLGLLVLILDALKGAIPIFIAKYYLLNKIDYTNKSLLLSLLILLSILGHSYSVFLKFSGGKSVSIMLGVYLVAFPKIIIFILLGFVLVEFIFDYVAVASMTMSFLSPIFVYIFYNDIYYIIVTSIIFIIITYRHKQNIINLINGKETKYRGN